MTTHDDEIADLTREVRHLTRRVVDLEHAPPDDHPDAASHETAPFLFDSAAAFAEQWLLGHVERRATTAGGETAWCAHWWRHPEAVLRVEVLWRSFEAARLDPFNGMATWTLNSLDPQVAMLTSRRGPLGRCTVDTCAGPTQLPTVPVPDDHPLHGR